MVAILKKYGKYIAAILIIAILIAEIPMFINGFKLNQVKAVDNENENRIAADISNMTGVEIEEIKKLRGTGRTWNEVLDRVKSDMYKKDSSKRREEVLAKDGIGEDYQERLEKEGFSKDEIMEAKIMVERVLYELKEITSPSDENVSENKPKENQDILDDKKDGKEEVEVYSSIQSKIDIKTAVYLMLKLKRDIGSIEKVFDEYLLALQLDINFEEYLVDKKEYEKQKSDKQAFTVKEVITLAKIQELALKKIQTSNQKNNTNLNTVTNITGNSTSISKDKSPIPEAPIPEVKDMKPQNPVNEIMKEIKNIDPMRNGGK